ncbi:hypothetical protein DBV32_01125 [Campylobacter upsaliensis]|nr:hypothetical protein [Campylobacter upsaliensis]EAJ4634711.1 hypothetical protein [Campylobacter upsaliensis]
MEFNFNFEAFEQSGKEKNEAINYLKSLNSSIDFDKLEQETKGDENAIYEALKGGNFSFSKPSIEQTRQKLLKNKENEALKAEFNAATSWLDNKQNFNFYDFKKAKEKANSKQGLIQADLKEKEKQMQKKEALFETRLKERGIIAKSFDDMLDQSGAYLGADLLEKGLNKLGFKDENYIFESEKEDIKSRALKSVREKLERGDLEFNEREKHALRSKYDELDYKKALEKEKERLRLSQKSGNFSEAEREFIENDLGFFNTLFNDDKENIKEFKEKVKSEGVISSEIIKAANTLKAFDEGNLFKNMLFADEKEKKEFQQNFLNDAYKIAELSGFDDVGLDKKGELYFIKDEQKYLVNTGFFDNFAQLLNDTKFEFAGGVLGGMKGFNSGKSAKGKVAKSILGAAAGSFGGAFLDAKIADMYLNRESDFKKNLDFAIQAGLLSMAGDGVILSVKPLAKGLYKGVKKGGEILGEYSILGTLKTLPQQNIQAAEKIINEVFSPKMKEELKAAQEEFGGSVRGEDLKNAFFANLQKKFTQKYGENDSKTKSVAKIAEIFNTNSLKTRQQAMLDLVRSDTHGSTLAYLLEIAKDDVKIQSNLKNMLNLASSNVEKNLKNLNINPREIKHILDEFEAGNKAAFKEVENQIARLYDENYRVVLSKGEYENIKEEFRQNGVNLEEMTPFLRDLEANVFNENGVTFTQLNNFRKNLNFYIFNKDKTPNFINTLKKIGENILKNEIDKGIDNIFSQNKAAYESIKELYSTSLKDYATLKSLNESIKNLKLQDSAKSADEVLNSLIKYAKGQGEKGVNNLQKIKDYLGEENNAFLEMQILNKLFKESVVENDRAGVRVFDSESFLGRVRELVGENELYAKNEPLKDFGENFAGYKGKEAIEKLLEEKRGQVANAFYKEGLGEIDLVWGDKNYGLEHILNKHGGEFKNLAEQLDEIITKGEVIKRKGRKNAYNIEHNGFKVGINQGFNQKGENKWIVTAFDNKVGASEKTAKTAHANDFTKETHLSLNSNESITQPLFKSKEAREFLELVEGFHKLYKNDANIAKNLVQGTASQLNTSIATSAEGAIKQKVVKGGFDPIFRLLPDSILFGLFSKQIQGGALRYHLKKALSRSLNYDDFKIKLEKELKRTNFNSNTSRLIDEFMQNLEDFNREKEQFLKAKRAEEARIKEEEQARINTIKTAQENAYNAQEANLGKDILESSSLKEDFGENFAGYKGKEAIEKLLEEQRGQVKGAFYKEGLGEIDLVWGDKNYGLEHILNKHGGEFKNLARELSEAVENGKIVKDDKGRLRLEYENKIVGIKDNWKGEKTAHWVVTAYVKKEKEASLYTSASFTKGEALPLNSKESIAQKALNLHEKLYLKDNDTPLNVEYKIVNKDDIKPTFTLSKTQFRSQKQEDLIKKIKENFNPDLLVNIRGDLKKGNPIITKQGEVISGNHRAAALKELEGENLAKYQNAVKEAFGVELKENEMLVRVADTSEAEIRRFSAASNEGLENNLGEQGVSLFAKYQDKIKALKEAKKPFVADDVYNLKYLVNKALGESSITKENDTSKALFASLARGRNNTILKALNELEKENLEQVSKVANMFFDNAGAFYNLTHDLDLPKMQNLQNYFSDVLVSAAKADFTRAEDFARLNEDIRAFLDSGDKNAMLKLSPNLVSDLLAKAMGAGFARFARLENPSASLYEFLNGLKKDLLEKGAPDLFSGGKGIKLNERDEFDFAKELILKGQDSEEKFRLYQNLEELKAWKSKSSLNQPTKESLDKDLNKSYTLELENLEPVSLNANALSKETEALTQSVENGHKQSTTIAKTDEESIAQNAKNDEVLEAEVIEEVGLNEPMKFLEFQQRKLLTYIKENTPLRLLEHKKELKTRDILNFLEQSALNGKQKVFLMRNLERDLEKLEAQLKEAEEVGFKEAKNAVDDDFLKGYDEKIKQNIKSLEFENELIENPRPRGREPQDRYISLAYFMTNFAQHYKLLDLKNPRTKEQIELLENALKKQNIGYEVLENEPVAIRYFKKEGVKRQGAKQKTINKVDEYAKSEEFKALSEDKQEAILSLKNLEPSIMPSEISKDNLENILKHFNSKQDKARREFYAKLFNDTKENPHIVLEVKRENELRQEYIKAYQHKDTHDLYYIAITKDKDTINVTGYPITKIKDVINQIKNAEKVVWRQQGDQTHTALVSKETQNLESVNESIAQNSQEAKIKEAVKNHNAIYKEILDNDYIFTDERSKIFRKRERELIENLAKDEKVQAFTSQWGYPFKKDGELRGIGLNYKAKVYGKGEHKMMYVSGGGFGSATQQKKEKRLLELEKERLQEAFKADFGIDGFISKYVENDFFKTLWRETSAYKGTDYGWGVHPREYYPYYENRIMPSDTITQAKEKLQKEKSSWSVKRQETKGSEDIIFTDKKGKEHTLTKETQKAWLEAFNLKSLEEAYIPNFKAEVKEAINRVLGGEEIKLTKGSFEKLVKRDREEFLPYIKDTLEKANAVIKQVDGALIFAKDYRNERLGKFFASVSRNDEGEWIITSNAPKNLNNLKNKLNEGGELLYSDLPELTIIAKPDLDANALNSEANLKDIIPQKANLEAVNKQKDKEFLEAYEKADFKGKVELAKQDINEEIKFLEKQKEEFKRIIQQKDYNDIELEQARKILENAKEEVEGHYRIKYMQNGKEMRAFISKTDYFNEGKILSKDEILHKIIQKTIYKDKIENIKKTSDKLKKQIKIIDEYLKEYGDNEAGAISDDIIEKFKYYDFAKNAGKGAVIIGERRKGLYEQAQKVLNSRFLKAKKRATQSKKNYNITYDEARKLFYKGDMSEEQKELFQSVLPIAQKLNVRIRTAIREPYEDMIKDTTNIAGMYRYELNTATLKKGGNRTDTQRAETLLHELIHSVTSRAMSLHKTPLRDKMLSKTQIRAIDEIEQIYKKLYKFRKTFKLQDENGAPLYGLTNMHEMLAELSNPHFTNKLKEIGLYEKLVNNIMKIILSVRDFIRLRSDKNVYEKLKQCLRDIIENYKDDFTQEYEKQNIRDFTLTSQTQKEQIYTQRQEIKNTLKAKINQAITNENTGEKAILTNKGISKMLSDKAISKSVDNGFSREEHLRAVGVVDELFKRAKRAFSKRDEKDKNLSIYRYNAPFKNANALMTLKEYKQNGKRIYSLELENLEAAKFNPSGKDLAEQLSKSKDADTTTFHTPIDNPSESIAQKSDNIYHSNPHLGAGLVGGVLNGVEQDENGNLSFDPVKFAMGFLGGAAGSKAVKESIKWRANKVKKAYPNIAKNNPALMEQIAKRDLLTYAKNETQNALTRLLNKNKLFDSTKGLFAGEKALLNEAYAPHKARLEKAKELEGSGADEIEIWEKTGWYKDKDHKWKFEISQRGGELDLAKIKDKDSEAKLGEILKDDELFKAYPQLRDMSVKHVDLSGNYGFYYVPYNDIKLVRPHIQLDIDEIKTSPYKVKEVLYHEIQHAIQHKEQFAYGLSYMAETYERYLKQHGEVEARNIQERMKNPTKIHPHKTMDTDIEDTIAESTLNTEYSEAFSRKLEKSFLDESGRIAYKALIHKAEVLPQSLNLKGFKQMIFNNDKTKQLNAENALIKTPVGEVKVNVLRAFNHYMKNGKNGNHKENRQALNATFMPTLLEPKFVTRDEEGTMYYYKPFISKDKEYHITSIAVKKNGNLDYATSYNATENRLRQMIKHNELVYEKD